MLHAAGFTRGVECARPEGAGDGLPDPLDEESEKTRCGLVSPDGNAHLRRRERASLVLEGKRRSAHSEGAHRTIDGER